MLTIILILILGISCGFLFRKQEGIIKIADRSLLGSIYLLLFLLGAAVGSNQTIIQNFAEIGLKAIILSLAGTFFSIILAFFVYRRFWKKNEK